MAFYTSSSYLTSQNDGKIFIKKLDGTFSTGFFEVFLYISNDIRYYDLYPYTFTGNGILLDGDTVLEITLEEPPGEVRIIADAGNFNKIFSFSADFFETQKKLVFVPSGVRVGGSSTIHSSFLLFNGSDGDEFTTSALRATLYSGSKVYGYALGVRFTGASGTRSGSTLRWGFGGFIFPRVVWLDKPSNPIELTFGIKEGSKLYKSTVMWDGNSFVKTHPQFAVQSTDSFTVQRNQYTSFYLNYE